MIAKLTGILDSIYDGFIILNVAGVGYRVFCSNKTVAKLPSVGGTASLLIETQVREDSIHLFGFSDGLEKQMFLLLVGVQGVSARLAVSILSVLSAQEVQLAVMTGDSKAFARAQGVGPKLATRVVLELKGKVGGLSQGIPAEVTTTADTASSAVLEETISALVNLGYGRSESGMIVAGLLQDNPTATVSQLIKLSLKELGKNYV